MPNQKAVADALPTMRKIEVVEPGGFLHNRDRYAFGDVRTIDAAIAGEFIRLGWAKCVDSGEQGERKPGSHQLQVDDSVVRAGSDAVPA